MAGGSHTLELAPYMGHRLQGLVGVAGRNRDFLGSPDTFVILDHGQAKPMGGLVGEYKYTVCLTFCYFCGEHLFQLLADNDFLLLHIVAKVREIV